MFERKRKPRGLPVVSELHYETGIHGDIDAKSRRRTLKPLNRRARRLLSQTVSQAVDKFEIMRIMRRLKIGKAVGPDGIANEVLRTLIDVLPPYLERLFNACLRLRYHPRLFKHSITVMIPKGGGAYDRVDREKLLEILIDFGIPEWSDLEAILNQHWHSTGQSSIPGFVPILHCTPAPHGVGTCLGSEAPSWLKSVQFYCFAFVDYTYIMAVSSSYRTNCRALEFAHEEILKWARPMGVTFSTRKYHLMHFKPPWSRDPDCRLTVNIEGFDTKNEPVDELKILGVIVDRRLRWTAHIAEIEAKVERQLAILTRFSGSVWGTPLLGLVTLYATKIRSTITYACPAWFIYGDYESLDLCLSGLDEIKWAKEHGEGKPNWSFPKYNLDRLKKLQYKCLLRISGALKGTCARVLEKELVIDDIEVTLTRHAMTHRAMILDTPEYEFLATVRSDLTQSGTVTRSKRHPFEVVDNQARLLRDTGHREMMRKYGVAFGEQFWKNPVDRLVTIRLIARRRATAASCKRWDEYRRGRAHPTRHKPAALIENWGLDNRKRYEGLSRAQSTMLIQCRTEKIGLNYYLYKRKRATSWECPCGTGRQTVYHMFMHCERLFHARDILIEGLRDDFEFLKLMIDHADIATKWAIIYFDLAQYKWPKDHRYTMYTKKKYDPLFEGT
ncbi:hypothetical protein FNAPI_416 [Fusarium napiforme]|uniref:Reverse transcriptase domain-containing protein n=1 Tax=Fusarium napiforme TaxID=42672 RepID=A0A8H5NIU1_9HYPO|nr:hypothetical protein FNAPI_416 [Fusarium napiforme]